MQFLLVVIVSFGALVQADEYFPIYSFNNGMVESGKSCSSSEWGRLKTAMSNALFAPPGRQLRHSRDLGFCDACRLNPMCLATVGQGCAAKKSNRRQLDAASSSTDTASSHMDRTLVTNATQCDAKVTAVTAAFVAVRSQVSNSCKALMDAPKNITCAWYTKECDINHFSLWSATSESMLIPKFNTTHNTFCSSLGRVTVRAETHFFLGKVQWELLGGPQNATLRATEYVAPYYLHGNDGANVHGAVFSPGQYMVRAVSENDPTQAKEALFTVQNC